MTKLFGEFTNIAFSVYLRKLAVLFTCLLNYRNSKNKNICKTLTASGNSGKDPALPSLGYSVISVVNASASRAEGWVNIRNGKGSKVWLSSNTNNLE
ncbi:hypothetical protein H8356DRAFT_1350373 [Neocallimastix lanati (nom. inval.)]|nr:hypothetical protein H8356DRAFT_1350373 [Neocallimastix sp. JGI-2020a]